MNLKKTILPNKLQLYTAVIAVTVLLLWVWVEEIEWYLAYHYAYQFDSLNYLYNTRLACGIPGVAHASAPNLSILEPNASQTWQSLITKHQTTAHSGWIISRHPISLGLCNRILDTASLFILAIASNRTLWIEWDRQITYNKDSRETARMAGFDQMFNSSFHRAHLKPPENVIANARLLDESHKTCFMHNLATTSDVNADLLKDEAVIVPGCDWWGGLLLQNPHYKDKIFHNLNFSTGFPIIFRSIFNLKPPIPKPAECNWMIQYRTKLQTSKWKLRPIDDFISCAISRGMQNTDYQKTWIITDDADKLLMDASPQSKHILRMMNIPQEKEPCRGQCGGRGVMELMYSLSQCKNAVLTLGSSFGACITSLAGIQPTYRVGRYGDCHEMPSNEPYDTNTVSRYGNTATFISKLNQPT